MVSGCGAWNNEDLSYARLWEHFAYKIKKISNGALTSIKDLDLLPSSIIIHRTPDFWSHNSSNTSVGVLVLASPSDIVVEEGVGGRICGVENQRENLGSWILSGTTILSNPPGFKYDALRLHWH